MTEQQRLPLYFGQPVIATELAVVGTISSVDRQPPRMLTELGQRVVIVAEAEVVGPSVKRDEIGILFKNRIAVLEVHELPAEIGERLLSEMREATIAAVDERLGRSQLPSGAP